ncbi:unnamed protein product [Toxocara canis]|uniref:Uncharacterized protein n=1 Tax=Toxocara canis TaxID=6265 RepID=A0A3P7H0V1_TOXCA|nr:unnamed protein product [Toxocara canis]
MLDLAKKGEWDVVMELLKSDQRFDLSLADSHGFNVLLLAVKDSKVGIFNKLLAYGADLYAATKVFFEEGKLFKVFFKVGKLLKVFFKLEKLFKVFFKIGKLFIQ